MQAILAPARLLYTVVGKERYARWYAALDSSLGGIDTFAIQYGGAIFAAGVASLAIAAAYMQRFAAKLVKQHA